MNATAQDDRPLIRKGQRWLFKGQQWRVHDILPEGVIVIIGPGEYRELDGITAEELYLCGELREEAPPPPKLKATTQAIEDAKARALKPKRPRKPKPPASPRAWACTILAIDTAKCSGWALWTDGRLLDFGEVDKDNDAALLALCDRARKTLPCLMALESMQYVYAGRSLATLVGLGAAREAWHRAWRDAGGLKGRIISVKPTRWRGALFGNTRRGMLGQGKKTRDYEQHFALHYVREHGLELPAPANDNAQPVISGDAAAAICLGRWATCAGEVGVALPLRLRVFVK